MSKPSRRANSEAIKQQRKDKNRVAKQLRERQKSEGLNPFAQTTTANHMCEYKTVAEERAARMEAMSEHVRIIRCKLPLLLKRLSRIPDPRNPKKIKHKLTVLML